VIVNQNLIFIKKTLLFQCILAVLFLLTVSCKKEVSMSPDVISDFDLTETKATIIAASEKFVIYINKGDTISLANCYTTDAKMMIPNEKSIIGKPAIQTVFSKLIKSGLPTFTMKPVGIWGNQDIMTAEEEWSFSDKEGKILDSGKSIEIYKMEDGKWRLFRDCYNSDFPCPKK
jgi:ketosteroid isomerase-like protein